MNVTENLMRHILAESTDPKAVSEKLYAYGLLHARRGAGAETAESHHLV